MTNPTLRRRLAQAVSVHWTPTLAERVRRRVGEAVVRQRKRRRIVTIALGLLFVGGVSYAFSRGLVPPRRASTASPPAAAEIPMRLNEGAAPPVPALVPTSPPAPAGPTRSPGRPRRETTTPSTRTPGAPETIASLFAAADAARLDGRFADAVAPLTAIFTRYPADPRAVIAAFQLGRVFADDLGDQASAGRAFATALALDPTGPLAKDAASRMREARAGTEEPKP